MTIIYETGLPPHPKGRYRVEVLTGDGDWAELEHHTTERQAVLGAHFQADRRHHATVCAERTVVSPSDTQHRV